jgi:hypothetical protein
VYVDYLQYQCLRIWCARLTSSPPSPAECHENWEPKPPVILWATPGLLRYSFTFYLFTYLLTRSRDSVDGIVTRYGLDGPGIESRWGEIFRTYPDRLRGPPSLLCNGYRVFPGDKGGGGVMLTTHPLLVPRLRKS